MDLTALNSTVIFSYPKTLRKTSQRLKTKTYPHRLRSVAASTSITENNKNSYSVNSDTLSNAYPYISTHAEQQQKRNEFEISANAGKNEAHDDSSLPRDYVVTVLN